MTSPAERARITFRMERWRSIFGGIIETAGNTFLLLIATRVFDLGPWAKALIAAVPRLTGGTRFGHAGAAA
jgi:hypothetical protein